MGPRSDARPAGQADEDADVEVEVLDGKAPVRRRRGRPRNSDGNTEARILEAARVCFAESGYAGASTHAVAAAAGLTTGALYHYFAGKRDLYVAVFHEVEEMIYERLGIAAAAQEGFVGKVEATLDELVRLHGTDRTLARFMHSVVADVSRHDDLREALRLDQRRDTLFKEIVDAGVATGELQAGDRRVAVDTIAAMVAGLAVVGALEPEASQARAVGGLKRLLRGRLLEQVELSS